jgi:hypothetical protein
MTTNPNDIPTADGQTSAKPVLSNEMYDKLKWVAQILLPAVAALYFSLAQIWGLPKAEEVVGTITVVDTFLGLLLGLSTKQYNNSDAKYDGVINVTELTDGRKSASLELKNYDNPADVVAQKEVTFKVNPS